MDVSREALIKLLIKAKRDHYECEDTWYNCPKSVGGCARDMAANVCDCGAEKHNLWIVEWALCHGIKAEELFLIRIDDDG